MYPSTVGHRNASDKTIRGGNPPFRILPVSAPLAAGPRKAGCLVSVRGSGLFWTPARGIVAGLSRFCDARSARYRLSVLSDNRGGCRNDFFRRIRPWTDGRGPAVGPGRGALSPGVVSDPIATCWRHVGRTTGHANLLLAESADHCCFPVVSGAEWSYARVTCQAGRYPERLGPPPRTWRAQPPFTRGPG